MMNPKDFFEFYDCFNSKYSKELETLNIGILSDFLNNKDTILEFYNQHVKPNTPKIVLCGINPGKNGAGRTGIPFLDFHSLSRIFPKLHATPQENPESSAEFIYFVIEHFGVREFYQQFYVTNLSCIGFYNLETGKNVNYHELPLEMQLVLFDTFVEEMNVVKPKIIIPLAVEVEKNLIDLKHEKKINAQIWDRLPHPSSRYAERDEYITVLEQCKNECQKQ